MQRRVQDHRLRPIGIHSVPANRMGSPGSPMPVNARVAQCRARRGQVVTNANSTGDPQMVTKQAAAITDRKHRGVIGGVDADYGLDTA